MNTTSVSLLQRLRFADDAAAWERFVRIYSPLLFSWVRRSGLAENDATDLVQDVFATLVVRLPEFRYDATGSFRAWLKTVTVNRCRDFLRRRGRPQEQTVSLDAEAITTPDPQKMFEEDEYRRHVIREALKILEREFQPLTYQACWRHMVLGESAPKVADELGMTANAVYLARSRVMRRLREELDGLID